MDENKAVMEQVEKDQGRGKKMTPQEIVRIAVERSMPGVDWKRMYLSLSNSVKDNTFRMLRSNNSIMYYRVVEPGVFKFHTLNAGSPKEIIKNFKEFYQAMKVAGFKKGISNTVEPEVVRMAQTAGVPIKVSMGEKATRQGYVPSYNIEVEIQ